MESPFEECKDEKRKSWPSRRIEREGLLCRRRKEGAFSLDGERCCKAVDLRQLERGVQLRFLRKIRWTRRFPSPVKRSRSPHLHRCEDLCLRSSWHEVLLVPQSVKSTIRTGSRSANAKWPVNCSLVRERVRLEMLRFETAISIHFYGRVFPMGIEFSSCPQLSQPPQRFFSSSLLGEQVENIRGNT